MTSPTSATELFRRARAGDDGALQALFPLVYDELRALAGRYMRREYARQTIQATALVHEAYLRLIPDRSLRWNDRAHFLALVARSMRQILVERARARHAEKRGGPGGGPVTLHDELLGNAERTVDVLALDEALGQLAVLDPRQARLVELRFFGGLTVGEAAEAMSVSPATLKRDWAFAQTWLRRQLSAKS
jgi:RNA polymerase sigma factor (TIGR02999 family)